MNNETAFLAKISELRELLDSLEEPKNPLIESLSEMHIDTDEVVFGGDKNCWTVKIQPCWNLYAECLPTEGETRISHRSDGFYIEYRPNK